MTLNKLPLNHTGTVTNIYCDSSIKNRFLDLGLIPGTNITPVFISPLKDPIAYEFRGNIIAIRKDEAEHIIIEKI